MKPGAADTAITAIPAITRFTGISPLLALGNNLTFGGVVSASRGERLRFQSHLLLEENSAG